MQGSYKNNGLPRPYYMKPNKRGSAYEKMPRLVFLTNSRKLTGYIIMLVLFGLCMFMVAQEMRPHPDAEYELVPQTKVGKLNGDVGKLVDLAKVDDKATEKADLAQNKAQNAKGEYGKAVLEAPKGGMVNEAPVVGNDEELVIDGRKKKLAPGAKVQAARKDRGAAAKPAQPQAKAGGALEHEQAEDLLELSVSTKDKDTAVRADKGQPKKKSDKSEDDAVVDNIKDQVVANIKVDGAGVVEDSDAKVAGDAESGGKGVAKGGRRTGIVPKKEIEKEDADVVDKIMEETQ